MHSAALAFLVWSVILWLPVAVHGNTEIVNFDVHESRDIALPFAAEWPVLRYGDAERTFHVTPAPLHARNHSAAAFASAHELWLILDFSSHEWARYTKFTLRASWPASSPADFSIQNFTPEALASIFDGHLAQQESSSMTRRQYAHITLDDTAVRTPSSASDAVSSPEPVPFIVLLEPLYFGVLPASIAPTIALLVLVVSSAMLVVPYVNRYISVVAQQARAEITMLQSSEKQRA